MSKRIKWLSFILLAIIAVFLSIKLVNYIYWVISPSTSPRGAILKYAKTHSCKYVAKDVKINETTYVDTEYGKLFTVDGIETDNGGLFFFYLEDNNGNWIVKSAGSGP